MISYRTTTTKSLKILHEYYMKITENYDDNYDFRDIIYTNRKNSNTVSLKG